MSKTTKTVFLGLCVIGSFLIYCVFYYSNMLKNAPFRFSDFESITLQYGMRDSMLNSYNSLTHDYQYLTQDGEVVKKKLKLSKDDLLYLHRKAMEMGFWNVEDDMTTIRQDSLEGLDIPRYVLEYKYKDKGKRVTFDTDYPGNQKMKDAAATTIEEVISILNIVNAR